MDSSVSLAVGDVEPGGWIATFGPKRSPDVDLSAAVSVGRSSNVRGAVLGKLPHLVGSQFERGPTPDHEQCVRGGLPQQMVVEVVVPSAVMI